jgi:hypothetical protein
MPERSAADIKPCKGTKDLNGPASPMTNSAVKFFIEAIQEERKKGRGFVPFVGAGFSSTAGAPLIREIHPYLQRCICLSIGADTCPNDLDHHDDTSRLWNPRTDVWPVFTDTAAHHARRDSRKVLFDHLTQGWTREGGPEGDTAIRAEAFGAAHEWRTALLFLSRIHQDGPMLRLGAPRREVIDACFREVLRNKMPALNHRMLTALAGALRLDLLLTTNFDDLLERAFLAGRGPLEVFDVNDSSSLPDSSALSSVRALVKLHGGKYSLRADYSLDSIPNEADKDRFLDYFLSPDGRHRLSDPSTRDAEIQSCPLMLGTVLEPRTQAFIEHAWTRLGSSFRVFWVCYSEDDVASIKKFTADYHRRHKKTSDWHGSTILRHTESGLLLLQLYQTIHRNLPPLLGMFPSVSRLTLPPLPAQSLKASPAQVTALTSQIEERVQAFFKPQDDLTRDVRPVVVSSAPTAGGVTTICGDVFRRLEQRFACLWFDMNDISSTDNLFEVLLEAARFRLGQEHWTPTYLSEENYAKSINRQSQAHEHLLARRTAEIRRLTTSIYKRWIIFLNARETPGLNVEAARGDRPNGWLDRPERLLEDGVDPSSCTESFIELLKVLGDAGCAVVLICRQADDGRSTALFAKLKADKLVPDDADGGAIMVKHPGVKIHHASIVAAVKDWVGKSLARERFVHALALMQRPRFLAVIWDPDVMGTEGLPDADGRVQWLDALERRGLIRRKPGGFIWMHSLSRERLRTAFLDNKKWKTASQKSALHHALARWYMKVTDVSVAPAAVFEAVYHLCLSAAPIPSETSDAWNARATQNIKAAVSFLKANTFLVQTRGYSRGSCRKLEYLRDTLALDVCKRRRTPGHELKQAIRALRIACTDVMRAIAREVGEDAKSYLRLQQGAILTAGPHDVSLKKGVTRGGLSDKVRAVLFDPKKAGAKGAKPALPFPREDCPIATWARWWRWCGMLAIGSRSLAKARRTLDLALGAALGKREYLQGHPPKTATVGLKELSDIAHLPWRQRIELLRTLEQQAQLGLMEIDAQLRARPFGKKDTIRAVVKQHVPNIIERITVGRAVAASLRASDDSSYSGVTMLTNWCDGRLLIHQSVCASFLVQSRTQQKRKMSQQAMGLLSAAEATLGVSDARRYRSDLAIVELHRGDARLREVEALMIDAKEPETFRNICHRWEMAAKADVVVPPDRPRNLQKTRGLLDDSLRFLNRAEAVLTERGRSVWWTTWFFERKLRAIAQSVWASVPDPDTPLPFLGPEAAPADEDTIADRLLEDAVRMIRVDSYRLTTILDAYASCLRALQVRLSFDAARSNVKPLPGIRQRQRRMLDYLARNRAETLRVRELRDASTEEDRPSSEVQIAIERMLARVNATESWIKGEVHRPSR